MTFSPISGGEVPLSMLDLAQIPEGGTAQTALHRSREMAQHAERLGFRRFWLAEHHNMAGIASAATSVAIGFVAEGTSTIRVGAGGVMLKMPSFTGNMRFRPLTSRLWSTHDLGLPCPPCRWTT